MAAEAHEKFFFEDNISLSLEVALRPKDKKNAQSSEVEHPELNLDCVPKILQNVELKLKGKKIPWNNQGLAASSSQADGSKLLERVTETKEKRKGSRQEIKKLYETSNQCRFKV